MSLRLEGKFIAIVLLASLFSCICAGQQSPPSSSSSDTTQSLPKASPGTPHESTEQKKADAAGVVPISKQQPKRIMGVMPNYRAVSAGAIPPPPTPKQSFIMATQNSFDYSAFIFVGITSMLAEGTDSHPDLGKGVAGFGRYYWRGFLDKASGNYLVMFAFPAFLHEDERYYAMGEGKFFKRGIYAASRVLITPDYHGHNTFNASEILGRAASQGISGAYYPAADRTTGALAEKFGWAVGRDALTNVFREYWPDIATHVLHRHP